MAQITQILSRALPEAARLPRVPAGGFLQPLAEGLGEVDKSLVGLAEQQLAIQQKELDELAEQQRTTQKVEDFLKYRDKFTLDLDALETEIKQDPESDNWLPKYKEKANQLLGQTMKNKMYPETRNALARTTSDAILSGHIQIKADALQFKNNTIRAGIEDKVDTFARQIALGGDAEQEEMKALFKHYKTQQVISPAEEIKWTQQIMEKADTFRAQRDLEDDPVSLVLLDEKELLKKYPNLSSDNYFELISKQNKKINTVLEQHEKTTKDELLSNLRQKASNRQVSYRELDRVRNEGRLKAGEYSTVRGILDKNLKTYKDAFTDQLTASLEGVGEQDKIKLQSTVFEAVREFETRAKRLNTITEEGNEYHDLIQDMLEKYIPVLFGGELISITPFPEGTIRPGEPQTTTTPTTTGKMSKEKSPTPTVTDKIPKEKTPTASTWTEERIISALKAGEITMDEAASLQDDLLLEESKRAPAK